MDRQFHSVEKVDEYRWGCELKECVGEGGEYLWVGDVLDRVDDVLHRPNIVSRTNHSHETGLTFLKTLSCSRAQAFHSDFELGGIFDRCNKPQQGEEDEHPRAPWAISVLMAPSKEGADLDLRCGRLHIEQYDAIVFAEDLRHAGSKYEKLNLRLRVDYEYDDGMYDKKVPSKGG